jgi:hypothetical protein
MTANMDTFHELLAKMRAELPLQLTVMGSGKTALRRSLHEPFDLAIVARKQNILMSLH